VYLGPIYTHSVKHQTKPTMMLWMAQLVSRGGSDVETSLWGLKDMGSFIMAKYVGYLKIYIINQALILLATHQALSNPSIISGAPLHNPPPLSAHPQSRYRSLKQTS
jgi:hypothetical protein